MLRPWTLSHSHVCTCGLNLVLLCLLLLCTSSVLCFPPPPASLSRPSGMVWRPHRCVCLSHQIIPDSCYSETTEWSTGSFVGTCGPVLLRVTRLHNRGRKVSMRHRKSSCAWILGLFLIIYLLLSQIVLLQCEAAVENLLQPLTI